MRDILQFADPIRMIEGRHGYMVYNQYCHYVGKALELYGEYCEHEIHLFSQLIKPTDVVWEIGANTGSQSTALARLVPEGRYIGFEPQVELFKILTANLTLNGLENAAALNIALGNVSGLIELPPVNYNLPNNFGAMSLLKPGGGKHIVELRTIDNLMWLPRPNFIKIDVEGMETMVLKGGESVIKNQKPVMYIENDRVEKSPELIQTLWDYGYELYWHITPYFNEDNFFQNKSNIYSNAHSFNMLCVHSDKSCNIEGLSKILDKDAHPLK